MSRLSDRAELPVIAGRPHCQREAIWSRTMVTGTFGQDFNNSPCKLSRQFHHPSSIYMRLFRILQHRIMVTGYQSHNSFQRKQETPPPRRK
ncbi:hypothetical protein, partial [Asticcacaulis taihuensis]|uniref:hypothetical protein n=1 Tax=Asticcacaulis taihuensis TaxID=260084 RepID=UPI0039EAF612